MPASEGANRAVTERERFFEPTKCGAGKKPVTTRAADNLKSGSFVTHNNDLEQ